MIAMLPLAVCLMAPPDPDWSRKKELVRERLAQIVSASGSLYGVDDPPQLTIGRVPGYHAKYTHSLDRLTLDIESMHDPEKFWHVYRHSLPHEMAHKVHEALYDERGHTDEHKAITKALMEWRSTGPQSK